MEKEIEDRFREISKRISVLDKLSETEKRTQKKCEHLIAFHIGHSPYTLKEYKRSKKSDGLDCCGGTMMLDYCPLCGKKNDANVGEGEQ